MNWRSEYTFRLSVRGAVGGACLLMVIAGWLILTVYVFRAPMLTWVGRQLIDEDPLAPADAIVVLSGGEPGREIEAADLYARHEAPLVVLTQEIQNQGWTILAARGVTFESPLSIRRRVLHSLGVPLEAIVVLDPVVDTTASEARVIVVWARAHGMRSLIVVTSAFHTGRAKYVFRRELDHRDIVLRMRAPAEDTFRSDSWWKNRVNLRDGLFEWQKQLAYRLIY